MFRLIGLMFRWVSYKLGLVSSGIDKKNDDLLRKNPELLRREGELAKKDLSENYSKLRDVISRQVAARHQKEARVKENTQRLTLVQNAKSLGIKSNTASKDRIVQIGFDLYQLNMARTNAGNALKNAAKRLGVSNTDDPRAQNDSEFMGIQTDLSGILQKERILKSELESIESGLQKRIDEDSKDVRRSQEKLVKDRATLTELEQKIKDLPGITEDAINEILSAEEQKRDNAVLQSLDNSSAENRMSNIERLRSQAVAEMEVANELSSTTQVESKYLDYAQSAEVNDEINALLSVGSSESHEDKVEVDQLPEG